MIASSTNQARHKPVPERSKKVKPIPAIVTIESEPELSKIDENTDKSAKANTTTANEIGGG